MKQKFPEQETEVFPLEKKLIKMCKSDDFDLAEAGFIISEVRDEKELSDYMAKFDGLCSKIADDPAVKSASDKVEKAEAIFDWFWNSKSERYNGVYRLTDVLDNQLRA